MNRIKLITAGVAAFWLMVLIGWHLYDPSTGFTEQVPGADNRPAGSARKADEVVVGEYFMKYEDATEPEGFTGVWPGFRGVDKDNKVKNAGLKLADGDFPIQWSFETGEGHAAPVIGDGRVFVLDYNEQLSSDALRCFNLETGKELWRRWYRVPMKRNHGFSRTIPALFENLVITISPEGYVMCCDQVTGDLIWTKDMKKEYGSEIPFWYTGQCPLVQDGVLVLAPAGTETLLCGVDAKTGDVLWETPNEPAFKMSHSSVMPMALGGKQQFVYVGVGGVCGVSAEKADQGKLLWSASKWQPSVVAPSPLQISNNQIFLVAGYGAGGALLQVDNAGGNWKAEIKDSYKADKGMSCEQQTPILYEGMLITILPKDGGGMRERIACYNPSDLHKTIWTSAADERFGLGPFMMIDDKFLAFKEDGELYVYKVSGKSMQLLKKQQIMEEGVDAWGPMAYADGRLIVRDSKNVVCLKISE